MNFRAKFLQSFLLTFRAFLTEAFRFSSNVFIFEFCKISFGPVTGKAAMGVPQARASRITLPKVSVLDGNTNTSALA